MAGASLMLAEPRLVKAPLMSAHAAEVGSCGHVTGANGSLGSAPQTFSRMFTGALPFTATHAEVLREGIH